MKQHKGFFVVGEIYNAALEQREICYRQRGRSPSCTSQKNELPAFKKELPEYKQVNAQVLQDCLQRLDDAFQRFFNGLAGYPRYKGRDHYRSFTYPQADKQDHFKRLGYIYLPKIGYVKIKAHFEYDPSKDLSIRMHKCPKCGLVADRDVVSAMVILQRAA